MNGKNSYDGYTGYQMFHATLNADPKGQYTSGTMDDIMADNATGDQLKTNVHYEDLCIQAGLRPRLPSSSITNLADDQLVRD